MVVNFSRSLRKLSRNPGLKKKKKKVPFPSCCKKEICLNLECVTIPTAFWIHGYFFLSHPVYTEFGYRLILSFVPYCHFQTISPLFSPEKEKNIQFLWSIQHFRLCHLLSRLQFRFVLRPHPGLTASLLTVTPTSLWAASTSTKDAGLLVPSPPHFQWSCPLSDSSHLLPGSDSGLFYDQE